MNGSEDLALVRRHLEGDPSAFDILYRKYYPRLYGYCRRLVNEVNTVEDLVQTTFLKAFESIRSLDDQRLFYYWLFTIARNEAYGTLRKRRTTTQVELDDDVWDEETPHDAFVRKETVELVEEALHRLKPEYREVLQLREFERLTYAEIAAITGASLSAVESRLFKARKALITTINHQTESRSPS